MKKINYFFAVALAFSVMLSGCDDSKEPTAPGRTDDSEITVQATLTVSSAEMSDNTFFVGADDASAYLDVESNYKNWTVVVTDGGEWLKAFSNNTATGDRARLELVENTARDGRSGKIKFSAGEGSAKKEVEITVRQFGYSPEILFPATAPVIPQAGGGEFTVTIGANVPFTSKFVDDQGQEVTPDWIEDITSAAPLSRAVATVNTVMKYKVAANDNIPPRSVTIRFTPTGYADQNDPDEPDHYDMKITQSGEVESIAITGEPTSKTVAWDEGTISLEVTSNIEYGVAIEKASATDPDPTWIEFAPEVRAFTTKTVDFTLTDNDATYLERRAVIVLTPVDEPLSALATRVTVVQTGKAVLTLASTTPSPLSIAVAGGDFSVVVDTNFPADGLTVTAPSFVTQGEVEENVPAAGQRTYNFSVGENTSGVISGDIVFSWADPETTLKVPFTQASMVMDKIQIKSVSVAYPTLGTPPATITYGATSLYHDGNKYTFVDTNYGLGTPMPETEFSLVLGPNTTVERIRLYPRSNSSGHINQMPKTVKFAYSTTSTPETFIEAEGTYSIDNTGATMESGVTIVLRSALANVHTLRMTATESYSNFVCLSEMEVLGGLDKTGSADYLVVSLMDGESRAINLNANPTSATDATVVPLGGYADFLIGSNVAVNVTLPAGLRGMWLSSTRAASYERIYRVSFPSSSIGYCGNIVFGGGGYSYTFAVMRQGNYYTPGTWAVNGNITLTIKAQNNSGELVETTQPGSDKNYVIDGSSTSTSTHWESQYSSMPQQNEANPCIYEFTFNDSPGQVSGFRVVPRNSNGDWNLFRVYVKPRGGDYPPTPTYEYTSGTRIYLATNFFFPTVHDPESVKIEVTQCVSGYNSCREIMFFQ